MLTVSTHAAYHQPVLQKRAKRRKSYHHGNLREALVREAVRTIREGGVEALTLRAAGARLGVSRTALYRHFADKSALLAAVAREGFQRFRRDLVEAWTGAGGGMAGLDAMGRAYIRFALANQSHYRVMFGGFREQCDRDPALVEDATAAFQALVDALVSLQQAGLVRRDDPAELARYIWAMSHGIAMLAIDGQLGPDRDAGLALMEFATSRLHDAVVFE